MTLTAENIGNFPTSQELLGQAARAWRDNKFAQAAREIAALDLRTPPRTGPPQNGQGMGRGFIDLLV